MVCFPEEASTNSNRLQWHGNTSILARAGHLGRSYFAWNACIFVKHWINKLQKQSTKACFSCSQKMALASDTVKQSLRYNWVHRFLSAQLSSKRKLQVNRSKQIDFFDAKSNTRNKKLGARASLLISNKGHRYERSKDAIRRSVTITVLEDRLAVPEEVPLQLSLPCSCKPRTSEWRNFGKCSKVGQIELAKVLHACEILRDSHDLNQSFSFSIFYLPVAMASNLIAMASDLIECRSKSTLLCNSWSAWCFFALHLQGRHLNSAVVVLRNGQGVHISSCDSPDSVLRQRDDLSQTERLHGTSELNVSMRSSFTSTCFKHIF